MKTLTIEITDKQYDYLQEIIFEDCAGTESEAVQYVLYSAKKCEVNYETDICSLSYRDIRNDDSLFPDREELSDNEYVSDPNDETI